MEKNTVELTLLEPDEREELDFIWNLIPEEDRQGMSQDDLLFVLDSIDDYLEEVGLLTYDEMTGEADYQEGEVDETEQLDYLVREAKRCKRNITNVQMQLILDAQYEFYLQKGWIEDDEYEEDK